jgi:hypothetical protein
MGCPDSEPGSPPADPEAAAREAATRLTALIREGEIDDRLSETATMLREHVRRKLAVARPGYDQ